MEVRRWLAPAGSSLAVLVVVLGQWWLTGPGSPGLPTGGTLPGGSGTGEPVLAGHATGDSTLGRSGGETPGLSGGETPAGVGAGSSAHPRGVVIDSYHAEDDTHLVVHYTIGVTGCYGVIEAPVVRETDRAVVVTLTPKMPHADADNAAGCIDVALLESVDVTLASPLAGRVVLDGAAGAPVPAADGPGWLDEDS